MAYNYNKEKLVKIGMEGHAMLDEFFGIKASKVTPQKPPPPPPPRQVFGRYQYQYQPQESHAYVVQQFAPPAKNTTTTTATLDCYKAARIYGGTVVVDYPKRKTMHTTSYY